MQSMLQISEVQQICEKENVKYLKVIGIPFNETPENLQEMIDQSIIYDEDGLIRNTPIAKTELSTQLLDLMSELVIEK